MKGAFSIILAAAAAVSAFPMPEYAPSNNLVQVAPLVTRDALEYMEEFNRKKALEKRQTLEQASPDDTSNDLTAGGCKDITVIFAMGTFEAGNIGELVGPAFKTSLNNAAPGRVAFQGVAYSANVFGYLTGGDLGGAATMAGLVAQAASQCGSTKIVMSGYSQGGQLVHIAGASVGLQSSKIVAAVIFGDPDEGKAIPNIDASKVDTICHQGDSICQGLPIITTNHLNYAADTDSAAQFVLSKSG